MFSLTSLLLQAYASKGYVCVAIDSRYHGERASNETTYIEVIIYLWSYCAQCPLKVWRWHPFILFRVASPCSTLFSFFLSFLLFTFKLRHWNRLGGMGIQCLSFLTRCCIFEIRFKFYYIDRFYDARDEEISAKFCLDVDFSAGVGLGKAWRLPRREGGRGSL